MAETLARAASLSKNPKASLQTNGSLNSAGSKLVPLASPGRPTARVLSPSTSVPASLASASGSSSPASRSRSPDLTTSDAGHAEEHGTHASESVATSQTFKETSSSESSNASLGSGAARPLENHFPGQRDLVFEGTVESLEHLVGGVNGTKPETRCDTEEIPMTKSGPPPGFGAALGLSENKQSRVKKIGPPPGFVEPRGQMDQSLGREPLPLKLVAKQDVLESRRDLGMLPQGSVPDDSVVSQNIQFLFGPEAVADSQQTMWPAGPVNTDVAVSEPKPPSSSRPSPADNSVISAADPIVPPPFKRNPAVVQTKVQSEPVASMSPLQQQHENMSKLLQKVLPFANVHMAPAPVVSSYPANQLGYGSVPAGFAGGMMPQANLGQSRGVGPEQPQLSHLFASRPYPTNGVIAEHNLEKHMHFAPQMNNISRGSGDDGLRKRLSGAALLQSLKQGNTTQIQETVKQQPGRFSVDQRWDGMRPQMWQSPPEGLNGISDPAIVGGTKRAVGADWFSEEPQG
jgi:hypothetical protein